MDWPTQVLQYKNIYSYSLPTQPTDSQLVSYLVVVFFYITIPPGTCKEAKAYRAGSHYLHYIIKWPERRKNPNPVVTWTPGNVQSRYAPQEPHTNWDGIFLCILLYLIISDFLWLKVTGFLVKIGKKIIPMNNQIIMNTSSYMSSSYCYCI